MIRGGVHTEKKVNIVIQCQYLLSSSNRSLWRSFGSPWLLLSSLSRMTCGERKLAPRLVFTSVLLMGESVTPSVEVSGVSPNISLELSRPSSRSGTGDGEFWLLPFLFLWKKKLAAMV